MSESGPPPGMPGGDDPGQEVAQRKVHRQHLILLRYEDGDGYDPGCGGLELRCQAVVVHSPGHDRQAADRQPEMGDGGQHDARAQAVRCKRKARRLLKMGVDELRNQAAGLVGDLRLLGIVQPMGPHRVARPQQAEKCRRGRRKLKQALPIGQAVNSVGAVHVEAVRGNQHVAALNRAAQRLQAQPAVAADARPPPTS